MLSYFKIHFFGNVTDVVLRLQNSLKEIYFKELPVLFQLRVFKMTNTLADD